MKANQELRRKEAEERNAKWAAKSATEQLAYLDNMFGEGKGAAKQRLKIANRIQAEASASPKKTKKTAK